MRRRKSDSQQKAALREMMASFMKDNNINVKDGNDVNDVNDVNAIMKEYQNTVTQDMEEKILSMYAKGMSTADIETQQCIIHQIRNSTKYVSYKDLKPLMADLKLVYAAPDESAAMDYLEEFADKWDVKYPKISKSWKEHWPNLSTYFKYPEAVRRIIYTTNTIEGFNRQLRKVTKSKTVFPSDDSLLKMLYLAMMDITKKCTGHRQGWGRIHSQLEIYFEERLVGHKY